MTNSRGERVIVSTLVAQVTMDRNFCSVRVARKWGSHICRYIKRQLQHSSVLALMEMNLIKPPKKHQTSRDSTVATQTTIRSRGLPTFNFNSLQVRGRVYEAGLLYMRPSTDADRAKNTMA